MSSFKRALLTDLKVCVKIMISAIPETYYLALNIFEFKSVWNTLFICKAVII